DALALLEVEDHRRVGLDRTDAVEAGDGSHDDHVVAFEQRARGRVAHAVDRLVHRAFLLDVSVRPRHVGFGLVVVVVRDKILDRVVRKEARELAVELGSEDLVRREDEGRALQLLDHLGHREGLARTGDAEQDLSLLALTRSLGQLADGGRLVAGGLVVRDELEPAPAHRFLGALRLVRGEGGGGVRFLQASANDEFGHVYEYGTRYAPPQSLAAWRVAVSLGGTRPGPSVQRAKLNAHCLLAAACRGDHARRLRWRGGFGWRRRPVGRRSRSRSPGPDPATPGPVPGIDRTP